MEKLPKVPVFAAEPLPKADTILFDTVRINSYVNKYKHSAKYWKNGCSTCRLTYKRQKAEMTYFKGLERDPSISSTVVPKAVAIPVSPNIEKEAMFMGKYSLEGAPMMENPVGDRDERVITYGLQRSDEIEQYQVEANPLTTACVRCNTSIQPLIAPSQVKATMYYSRATVQKTPLNCPRLSLCVHKQI